MTADAIGVSLEDIRGEALSMLGSVPDGEPLDACTAALIGLAVRATASAMDMDGTRVYAERALDVGATPEQVHETLVLVSGIGVHTLMEGSRRVLEVLRERGSDEVGKPLDDRRRELWQRYVGEDPYWERMEAEVPGFLEALLRLSPEAFVAFFDYCAVPWKTGVVRAKTKELISLAVDATPTHRYLPGMRLHLANAVQLGVGRAAVLQALEIAAEAPPHRGLR
jgi:alkylhydroperoxidase/carboxymuconolactone decarboxylase family protein YurZ